MTSDLISAISGRRIKIRYEVIIPFGLSGWAHFSSTVDDDNARARTSSGGPSGTEQLIVVHALKKN